VNSCGFTSSIRLFRVVLSLLNGDKRTPVPNQCSHGTEQRFPTDGLESLEQRVVDLLATEATLRPKSSKHRSAGWTIPLQTFASRAMTETWLDLPYLDQREHPDDGLLLRLFCNLSL